MHLNTETLYSTFSLPLSKTHSKFFNWSGAGCEPAYFLCSAVLYYKMANNSIRSKLYPFESFLNESLKKSFLLILPSWGMFYVLKRNFRKCKLVSSRLQCESILINKSFVQVKCAINKRKKNWYTWFVLHE